MLRLDLIQKNSKQVEKVFYQISKAFESLSFELENAVASMYKQVK
jgi:hypothetical protein